MKRLITLDRDDLRILLRGDCVELVVDGVLTEVVAEFRMTEQEYIQVRNLSHMQVAKSELRQCLTTLPDWVDEETFNKMLSNLTMWVQRLYSDCINNITEQE